MLRGLRTRFHPPALERAAVVYTTSGEFGAIWIAGALAGGAVDRDRRRAWFTAGALVFTALCANAVVKRVVRRKRPHLPGLPPIGRAPSTPSFPSGHAATSFAGAHAIGTLVPGARPPLVAAAALMALTRSYLGVHYPSDVIAGAVVGTVVAARLMPAPDR